MLVASYGWLVIDTPILQTKATQFFSCKALGRLFAAKDTVYRIIWCGLFVDHAVAAGVLFC